MLYYSVTAASTKGQRKYMEDRMVIKHIQDDEGNQAGIFVAVLDGHGGPEASEHVRQILWDRISESDGFLSSEDSEVLSAMKNAYLEIHHEMREFRDSWPKRPNGYLSTAGTTCSCALIRNNKIYTAHCGDSRILLLSEDEHEEYVGIDLTRDHKPDDLKESQRIQEDGGKITHFTPVARVIWTREVIGTENQTESIPFLSIARSLGDYWSYVEQSGRYAVSPVPDLSVREIDWERDHYLILVTDGITNVLSSNAIATLVEDWKSNVSRNISRYLLKSAISGWRNLKADNMSIISVGFHNQPNEFKPTYDLNLDTSIEERLTLNPSEILLVYPQRLLAANPKRDDVIVVNNEIADLESYSGPGYISSILKTNNAWRQYVTLSPKSSILRNSIHTQSVQRRHYQVRLKHSPGNSSFILTSRQDKISRIDCFSTALNTKRALSSTPPANIDITEETNESKIYRQSWPLSSRLEDTILLMKNSESRITLRPQTRNLWPQNPYSPANTDNLTLEGVKTTQKRKRNLEADEIDLKRRNCKV